jgi:hexosaminidase
MQRREALVNSVWLAISMVLGGVLLCGPVRSEAEPPAIIPQPVRIVPGTGVFHLTSKTVIVASGAAIGEGAKLRGMLARATGFELPVVKAEPGAVPAISLQISPSRADLGREGYRLVATPASVAIEAADAAGLFYGAQTLRQLLPVEIFARRAQSGLSWDIPCVEIEDRPRFAWRGLHLDVGRHLFSKEEVKKYIELMALHKLNTFHWHLTDDQGWRMEVLKHPRLTDAGAWRKESPLPGNRNSGDRERYGGYFTQEEIREIVQYATDRHITVVPEIEMPGHSLSVLTAYPELACTAGPFEVGTRWGVFADVLCAGNDKSLELMEDVLTEAMALFPSPFIHIGGDECPKDRWKKCEKCQARMKKEGLADEHALQSYFIRRIEKFLNAHGRRLIGWDEILEGGLAPNAAVMSWRGESGGITAANAGHDVVMSPSSHCYLDFYQSENKGAEPEAIGGFLPLKKVYSYDPVPAQLAEDKRSHVLGVQGNVWTEYIGNFQKVEFMAYPRGCALAEVAWSPAGARDYAGFLERLRRHLGRLDGLEVNYRRLDEERAPAASWKSGETTDAFAVREWNVTPAIPAAGTYEVKFQFSGGTHRLDIDWVELAVNGNVAGRDDHDGVTGATHAGNVYSIAVGAVPPGATLTLRANVRSDGGSDSNGEIFIALRR